MHLRDCLALFLHYVKPTNSLTKREGAFNLNTDISGSRAQSKDIVYLCPDGDLFSFSVEGHQNPFFCERQRSTSMEKIKYLHL